MLRPLSALVLAVLASCGGTGSGRTQAEKASRATPEEVRAGRAAVGGAPGAGVPHTQVIDQIVLAPDGGAALTRDSSGGWRVWAAVDGSAQPQLLPARAARVGSVARRQGGGLLIAMIDSASGARLFRADETGQPSAVTLRRANETRTFLDARVLPGGRRVVFLGDDHVIQLVSDGGEILASLDERGFRPGAIAVSASGRTLVAVGVEPGTQKHDLVIHTIAIDEGKPGAKPVLRLLPEPVRITSPAAIGQGMLSLSPSGKRIAFFEVDSAAQGPVELMGVAGASWRLVVAELAGKSAPRRIGMPFPQTDQVSAGFVDEDTILASSMPTSASWRIDLGRDGDLFPHESAANQFGGMTPLAYAPGVRAAGYGSWLFVETVGRGHLYLGYDRFEALFGSISPDKQYVAWASSGNGVYIRPLAGGTPENVHFQNPDASTMLQRGMFVDDQHLLLLDSTGGARLVHWKSGAEIGVIDVGPMTIDVDFDAARGLLRFVRQGGQTWLYRVSIKKGMSGPYIVGDGAVRSGFLAPPPTPAVAPGAKQPPRATSGDVLWTVDAQNKYRTYTMAEIERGLSRKAVDLRGTVLEYGAPSAIDRLGRFYVWSNDGTRSAVQRFRGPRRVDMVDEITLPLTVSFVSVTPSPSGERLAFLRGDGIVSLYDRAGDKPDWSRAFLVSLYSASWSNDGSLIAVSGHLGAAVLDAATGRPVDITCGPWFEVRRTAPPNPFGMLQQPSLCESPWPVD